MPSVGSMLILLDKCNIDNKEQVENNLTPFPSIDPLCGYFVLNPDGTLKRYESIFKEYFEEKKLKVLYMFKFDKNRREEPLDV